MHIWMDGWMDRLIDEYIYVCDCERERDTYIHTHTHILTYIMYIRTYVCTYVHMSIHIYIHTCTHTCLICVMYVCELKQLTVLKWCLKSITNLVRKCQTTEVKTAIMCHPVFISPRSRYAIITGVGQTWPRCCTEVSRLPVENRCVNPGIRCCTRENIWKMCLEILHFIRLTSPDFLAVDGVGHATVFLIKQKVKVEGGTSRYCFTGMGVQLWW